MEDITPLNLEDSPKLFGMRYDQLIAVLGSLIASTQLYSWLNPIPFMGHDLRLDVAIVLGLLGPAYCLITLNHTCGQWETIINFYTTSQVFVPGPDPNQTRFLTDELLPEFEDILDQDASAHGLEYSENPMLQLAPVTQ